jgi:hypothetical protein
VNQLVEGKSCLRFPELVFGNKQRQSWRNALTMSRQHAKMLLDSNEFDAAPAGGHHAQGNG